MGVAETLNALTTKISELYREIVTTSVRFEDLQRSTDKTLARMEVTIEQLATKVSAIHDEHVREKANLEALIATLQGRLTSLSEHALHSVVRDVAREIIADSIREQVLADRRIGDSDTKDPKPPTGA
jgi:chromosome segregation ATPase